MSMKTQNTYVTCYMESGTCKRAHLCESCHNDSLCPVWPVECISCGHSIEEKSSVCSTTVCNGDMKGPQTRITYICCSPICDNACIQLTSEFLGGGGPTVTQYQCTTCKKVSITLKRCSRCRHARYCSVKCQRKDWHQHKKGCNKVNERLKSDE